MNRQTRVFIALVAGLVFFALFGVVAINDFAADQGAQAGSAQLATAAFQASGGAQLDQAAAVSECERIIGLDAKLSTNITCIAGQDGTGVYIESTVSGPGALRSTHRSYVTYGAVG